MFYWLTELSDKISFFNVFRYITFRTGGAIVTALVFVFLFGGPIIDLDELLLGPLSRHFRGRSGGANVGNTRLATIKKAKAFPENVEVAFLGSAA